MFPHVHISSFYTLTMASRKKGGIHKWHGVGIKTLPLCISPPLSLFVGFLWLALLLRHTAGVYDASNNPTKHNILILCTQTQI